MNEVPVWKVPKWPFIAVYVLLLAIGFAIVIKAEHPLARSEMLAAVGCLVLGSGLCCLPFVLDYRACCKMIEVNALSSVAEQMGNLKDYSAQIAAATGQWAQVQEATKGNTDKTVAAAQQIADRMTAEIRDFNEFQVKLNDTEKGALRLEVEKLRRNEGEWLQVIARILDHIFALQTAAARSGNADLAEQIGHFQNACRDAARRVGVVMQNAEPGEKFEAPKHRAHGMETPPADAVVAEMLAPGMTFQGHLLRPVLVRLQDAAATATAPAANPEPAAENPPAPAGDPASGAEDTPGGR